MKRKVGLKNNKIVEDEIGIKPKKSLGQNFLNSDGALDAIISAGKVMKGDKVLEIGPGKGALTKRLLKNGAEVVAVEKDDRLIPTLKELFAKEIKSKKLILIHGDILDLDVKSYLTQSLTSRLSSSRMPGLNRMGYDSKTETDESSRGREIFQQKNTRDPSSEFSDWIPTSAGMTNTGKMKYKLIANIPYYITGEITRKFLSGNFQPSLMVILVQKEVAERITTSILGSSKIKEGKESILSISVKVYGEPKYIQTVKAGCFFPPPKVDSAILLIDNISKKNFKNTQEEQKFFKIVKTGFAHKRKTLSSNLKEVISKEKLIELGIKENERAENLSLEQWLLISKRIKN